jgi:DNA-binding NarL/FixJ family response regulator
MRFIIADDHPLYLEAVREQVVRSFSDADVRTAVSVDGVIDLLNKGAADIVMLDYSMPGMCGAEGLRRVIAVADGAPVLVMSGVASRQDVVDCIAMGAKGYIPKTLEGLMFSAAISLVAGGATYVPTEFVNTDTPAPPIVASADAFFSERELAMLRLLVGGASNKEIARCFGMQEVTVKYHFSRLYRRMGVSNRAQAVAAAVNAGITASAEKGSLD